MIDPKTQPKLKEKIDALSEPEKLVLFAELGKKDLFFLSEYILGYKGLNRELHGELCDFLQEPHRRKLTLIPRGHLKSTLGTVAYCVWLIINNPEIRILIANATNSNAEAFLREVKGHFEQNETFRSLYHEIIPKDFNKTRWNESEILIKREKNLKEPTISVVGVGGNLVSAHYDVIIGDDLVNDKNTATKEQVEKVKSWYSAALFLLEPTGMVNLIGTRWHFDDLYGSILDDANSPYVIFKKGIYTKDHKPIFPEKYSLDDIKAIEQEVTQQKGRAFFVSQYMNEVIDEDSATFKRKDVQYFVDMPKTYATSLVVDPAISEAQGADYSAFTVRAVNEKGHWYIVDVYRERGMPMSKLIDKIFELYKKWKLDAVGIEMVAYQKAIQYELQAEMQRRNIYLPLYDLHTETRTSKEYRIKSIAPRFENKGIFFKKNDEMTEYLLDELFRFPKASHDDLIDSLAYHQQIPLSAKESHKPTERTRDRYGHPIRRRQLSKRHNYLVI